jgi:DNA-binding MarR family transcriptional regulator
MPNQPLSTLLSQAFTAFVIECDNEAEHRVPHKTTMNGGPPGSPWLVSSAMYWNCLRWLGDDGLTLEELERRARTATNVDGMRRWGYVRIEPAPGDGRKVRRDSRLVPTAAGRTARELWQPLYCQVESRWAERFGAEQVAELSTALGAIAERLGPGLPCCMPILRFALALPVEGKKTLQDADDVEDARLLGVRMARVLLGFAREFERQSHWSMCTYANLLRVLDAEPKLASELPGLSGISKEAVSMGLGVLIKVGLVRQAKAEAGRGQQVWLTPKGWEAKQAAIQLHECLEREWSERFEEAQRARKLLQQVAGTGRRGESRLFEGLKPYPGGWRARVRGYEVLPHFPAVLHRGGFPDGS